MIEPIDFDRVHSSIECGHIVGSIPWLIVLFAGAIIGARRLAWRPRESWFAGTAIVFALFAEFGWTNLISTVMRYVPWNIPVSTWDILLNLPASMAAAFAWILLLIAAFGNGSRPRSTYLAKEVDDLAGTT